MHFGSSRVPDFKKQNWHYSADVLLRIPGDMSLCHLVPGSMWNRDH